MKTKHLGFITTLIIVLIVASCSKGPEPFNSDSSLIDDKDKIDIKGSLSNGDMRNPNIEAGYWGKTVYVYFHEELGDCEVSISNTQGNVVFCDTIDTYPYASVRYYMGDLPLGRYHLVISNGTDKAEGWFHNFRIVVVHKPH